MRYVKFVICFVIGVVKKIDIVKKGLVVFYVNFGCFRQYCLNVFVNWIQWGVKYFWNIGMVL